MSRIVLILPPNQDNLRDYERPPQNITRIPPIGLFHIASYLKSKGHDPLVIDCRALIVQQKTYDYLPYLRSTIKALRPEYIGINVLTAQFYEATNISAYLYWQFKDIPIILGGVHPSVEPKLTLEQNPYANAICVGEGEDTLLDLLNGNKNPLGLMWRDRVSEYKERPPEKNIDKYPPPDFTLGDSQFYTAYTKNTLNGWGYKGLGVLTSRSCPYSCSFCASDWSKPYRSHSVDYVVDMIKGLSKYNIDVITFYDDSLATERVRLEELCRAFIKHRLFQPYTNLRWFSAMRANQVTSGLLRLMDRAGCFGMSIGIESGSDDMLSMINKKTTVEMNRNACEMVLKSGLSLSFTCMLGIPNETKEDMNQTVKFMSQIKCHKKGIGTFRPLPGSPFYNEFTANGTLVKDDWENLGDFTTIPDTLYCEANRNDFEKYYDRALRVCSNSKMATLLGLIPLELRKQLRRIDTP